MTAGKQKPSVLFVSYPLLPVSDESAGGAEQMLWLLEREMASRGYRTTVSACAASRVAGELFASGAAVYATDQYEAREREHRRRTLQEIRRRASSRQHFDLVHDKSGSFWSVADGADAPVLATLHLPRAFYRPELFHKVPQNVFFNCVSASQAREFDDLEAGVKGEPPPVPRFLGVVPNGIAIERFPFTKHKSGYLLWIGRICEEKGAHLAIEAAAMAGLPLVLAGRVYPFSYHRQYFERRIRPHLDASTERVRFLEAPPFAQKLDLLRHARALLVPSLCDETSSLVAMEAMACGTPVIGFRRGAIPDVVADGETGILADDTKEMAEAVARVSAMDPRACRDRVQRHFSARRMARDYEQLYGQVITGWRANGARSFAA